jgi:hypothetical protein
MFTYFKPMHLTFKENSRLDLIIQFMPCQILACKFLSDKTRVIFSLSCGLCMMIDTTSLQVLKLFALSSSHFDMVKVIEDKTLVLAGMDTQVKVYSLDSEKLLYKQSLVH